MEIDMARKTTRRKAPTENKPNMAQPAPEAPTEAPTEAPKARPLQLPKARKAPKAPKAPKADPVAEAIVEASSDPEAPAALPTLAAMLDPSVSAKDWQAHWQVACEHASLPRHPLSAAFAEFTREEMVAFLLDVDRNGVRLPCTSFDGECLDGWNRQVGALICRRHVEWIEFDGDTEAAQLFVGSMNAHRRILSAEARAKAAYLDGSARRILEAAAAAKLAGASKGGEVRHDATWIAGTKGKKADQANRALGKAKKISASLASVSLKAWKAEVRAVERGALLPIDREAIWANEIGKLRATRKEESDKRKEEAEEKAALEVDAAHAEGADVATVNAQLQTIMDGMQDTIDRLRAELEAVTAERDAAIAKLKAA